ncbi:hypothetical protein HPB47_009704 [Ixodes persulcatus]|uniref:Uncharacterized protein n=1 Tax=Ixodes persulcatus TaxID=34615 RepID=A0AC60P130_IXOPE|nr:hypothetical protein HPB47_009704 [Ixodes persulcatus]
MAAQLEHEMAALNVQHQDAMEGARRRWDEEKRALRVAHAEELQRCLEQLRASLAKPRCSARPKVGKNGLGKNGARPTKAQGAARTRSWRSSGAAAMSASSWDAA